MNEERMKILKMIEEGIVSAEEGAKLLSAVEETDKSTSNKSMARKYGIKEFIGEAMDKIKNSDFDLSFGESVEFDYESETDIVDFHDLDLSIANGSLDIETWNENSVKAKYRVKVYQVETEEEAKEYFMSDGQFDIANGLLRLASPSKKIKTSVQLFLPKRRYEFMKAKLSNGSVKISDMNSENFQVKTSNGTVRFTGVSGDNCKVETGNGPIRMIDGDFGAVEADTITGAVKLVGDFGKSDVSAVSGTIDVQHTGEKAHTGFYKTTTGSINVEVPHEKRVEGNLRTSFGSLNCQLGNYKIISNKKEMMNKQLGFEAFEEYETAYHIEAETKTGSVTLTPANE